MKQIHVLFVDDEENVLNSIQRLFADESYGVVVARTTAQALEILAKEKIKVVLSDYRMPDMSGVQFLHRVKTQYPDPIRILFTAYADLTVAEQAINISEVFRFINKPWNSHELKACVVNAMYHYDLILENRQLLEAMKSKNLELQTANSRLKDLYDIQKEFSSTVSHELRTPLASIKAAIDIVSSGTAGPLTGEQKTFLGKSKESIDRLNRLINNILDLAQMESGKTKLDFKSTDLNKLIQSVVDMQQNVAAAKGLSIKAELDVRVPELMLDSDKIIQVISNLINNAIKFTVTGGITVKSYYEAEGNHIQVSVMDTGPGIEPENVVKLFEKFQQLGDPQTKVGGTGLGLAICKEIIRQHSGTINVESKLGFGSNFYFILPLEERRRR